MGRSTPIDLPVDRLADLSETITGILCAVLKVDVFDSTKELEGKISKSILAAWIAAAKTSLDAPVDKLAETALTAAAVAKLLTKISTILSKPLSSKQQDVLRSRLRTIWRKSKQAAAKEVLAKLGRKVEVSFSQVDDWAIKAINRHQVFWVGEFYSRHLAERIQAVAEEVILRQGFGRKEAGKRLREVLGSEFGIVPGGRSSVAPNIPARFAGNPDLYFSMVASNAANQARIFGALMEFQDAGVITYEVLNPLDERTGEICLFLAGQTFSVATGVAQMTRMLEAESPEEIKEISPWLSARELEDAVGDAKIGSKSAEERLAAAGASLPPYHVFCRSTIAIVS